MVATLGPGPDLRNEMVSKKQASLGKFPEESSNLHITTGGHTMLMSSAGSRQCGEGDRGHNASRGWREKVFRVTSLVALQTEAGGHIGADSPGWERGAEAARAEDKP